MGPRLVSEIRRSHANTLNSLGLVYEWLPRYDEAITCYNDSLAIFQELGDPWGDAHNLTDLGIIYERLGQHAEAITCHQQSLAIFRQLGDPWGQGHALNSRGMVYQRQGRYTEAITCRQDSLAIFRKLGDPWSLAYSLNSLGLVYQRQGWHTDAITCHQDSLTLYQNMGGPHGKVEALHNLHPAWWGAVDGSERHRRLEVLPLAPRSGSRKAGVESAGRRLQLHAAASWVGACGRVQDRIDAVGTQPLQQPGHEVPGESADQLGGAAGQELEGAVVQHHQVRLGTGGSKPQAPSSSLVTVKARSGRSRPSRRWARVCAPSVWPRSPASRWAVRQAGLVGPSAAIARVEGTRRPGCIDGRAAGWVYH